jgi:16S rRNA (cytosine967-C5)-methyltransferase
LASPARGSPNPRAAAARVLTGVTAGASLADSLPAARVDARDRALLSELCHGACRWYHRLDALLARLAPRPFKPRDADVRALLLVGLYQLVEMRVASHAAVAETVEAARALGKPWAAGLVNAVLRSFLRDPSVLDAVIAADPVAACSHPEWLLRAIEAAWPADWPAVLAAANARPPMTLRVNRLQGTVVEAHARLAAAGLAAAAVPCAPDALVLERPVDVAALPGFAEGLLSVQDAAAQLAAPLLDVRPGQRVLDACAAPGGKTAHLLETCPAIALTAVDVDERRLERVRENLRRLHLDAAVAQGDVARPQGGWAHTRYPRILLDAPCTATGVIRRHPDIKLLRRAEDVAALAERQARILDAVWPLLEPGGILLYVTCSVLPDENALQIDRFLERHADALPAPIEAAWGSPAGVGRQLLPGESGMDGFFYARLMRAGA